MEVISIGVECPWCGAKPGERCTEADSFNRFGWRYVREGYGHQGRVEEVRDSAEAQG